jgi:hypothetical protein
MKRWPGTREAVRGVDAQRLVHPADMQVSVHQDDAFAVIRQHFGEVDGDGGFTVIDIGRGEQHDARTLAGGRAVEVAAEQAEGFGKRALQIGGQQFWGCLDGGVQRD